MGVPDSLSGDGQQHQKKGDPMSEQLNEVTEEIHLSLAKRNYQVKKLLGKGQTGQVVEAFKRNNPEQSVAIKIEEFNAVSINEVKIHRQVMQHSNIISLHDDWINGTNHFIVQEYAGGGDLLKMVRSHGPPPEILAKHYFVQIVRALLYIHEECSIIHRDIKLENVLVSECLGNVYLADWDLADFWSPSTYLYKFCGSPQYAAPEIFKGIPYSGPEIDVWSVGVLLFALVTGAFPFYGPTAIDIAYRVQKGRYDEQRLSSPELKELVSLLLQTDSRKRISLRDALNHPWCSSVGIPCSSSASENVDSVLSIPSNSSRSAAEPLTSLSRQLSLRLSQQQPKISTSPMSRWTSRLSFKRNSNLKTSDEFPPKVDNKVPTLNIIQKNDQRKTKPKSQSYIAKYSAPPHTPRSKSYIAKSFASHDTQRSKNYISRADFNNSPPKDDQTTSSRMLNTAIIKGKTPQLLSTVKSSTRRSKIFEDTHRKKRSSKPAPSCSSSKE